MQGVGDFLERRAQFWIDVGLTRPEAMENGALPWEATSSALDLLRHYHENGWGRPPILLARWYWRVSLVIPDEDVGHGWALEAIDVRLIAAIRLAELEILGPEVAEEGFCEVEWWLAYTPGRSKEHDAAYGERTDIPKLTRRKELSPEVDLDVAIQVVDLRLPGLSPAAHKASVSRTLSKGG